VIVKDETAELKDLSKVLREGRFKFNSLMCSQSVLPEFIDFITDLTKKILQHREEF
jgi:hypothetical protein